MSVDILQLTGAQAAERVRAGELSPGELFDFYRERAEGDDLNAYLWVADGRKLRFDVEVRDGERTIGVGTHERRVVDAAGPGG